LDLRGRKCQEDRENYTVRNLYPLLNITIIKIRADEMNGTINTKMTYAIQIQSCGHEASSSGTILKKQMI
jgi:hypothetical protein